jgi:hypothetical protein
MVMIYPKEGSIIHNHTAMVLHSDFVTEEQAQAANEWIEFLLEDSQQRAFMQEGFRPATNTPCIDPLGSPFSQCTNSPRTPIYPDRIEPDVASAILKAWD